jgi:precorrin-3B C17-methyltransferase
MRSSRPDPGPLDAPRRAQDDRRPGDPGRGPGNVSVVGLGPGDASLLTPLAAEALARADVLVGYGPYLDLVSAELKAGKELMITGMTRELDRARQAVAAAAAGRSVAVVSSGDAGVYGMAGLVLEVLEEAGLLAAIDCQVVPGVPALAAAAALLGAPLGHDFAVVSLSDLLTPWEVIENRLAAAAGADFILVLYNPRSRRRDWQLPQALRIIAAARPPETPVGVVRNAYREEQSVWTGHLDGLDPDRVDMLSIVLVGNRSTRLSGAKMITPRGYFAKYG